MERRVKLGDIEFSVVEDEKPRDMVTITDHQVENGQDVSDHIKQESSIIDIVGVIVGDDAADTLSKLQKHQKEGKLSTYIGRNIYQSMAIQTIDRNHGKQIRNGFAYNITLKQVRVSTAKEVEIKVVNPVTRQPSPKTATQVKAKTNNGKQQVKAKPISNTTSLVPVNTSDISMVRDPFKNIGPGGTMQVIRDLYKPKTVVRKGGELIS